MLNPLSEKLRAFAMKSGSRDLILEVVDIFGNHSRFREDKETAADLLAGIGEYRKAVEMLEKVGDNSIDTLKKANYYDKAGEFDKARELRREDALLRIRYNLSPERKVLALLKQTGMSEREAYIIIAKAFEESGKRRLAAEYLKKAGEWSAAAKIYLKLGDKKKENECLDKAERLNTEKMNLMEQGDLFSPFIASLFPKTRGFTNNIAFLNEKTILYCFGVI